MFMICLVVLHFHTLGEIDILLMIVELWYWSHCFIDELNEHVIIYVLYTQVSSSFLQKYRQCMAGLLAPPYGVMESGPNSDSK